MAIEIYMSATTAILETLADRTQLKIEDVPPDALGNYPSTLEGAKGWSHTVKSLEGSVSMS